MRGNAPYRWFRVLFVAKIAIELLTLVGKLISDVQLVLFGIEECVEIVSLREVALWRARGQSGVLALSCFVADRAGLLRAPGELRNVTFDARLVTGEF